MIKNFYLSTPSASGQTPWSYTATYNAANQRTKATLQDNTYWAYEYDDLGQINSGKKYDSSGVLVPGEQFTYNQDDIANRISNAWGGDYNGQYLTNAYYTVNPLNQYTLRDAPGTGRYFFYDVDGNLTSYNNWIYTWDAENRLIRMVSTVNNKYITFDYDYQGRRIAKKVWNNSTGSGTPSSYTKFFYDGWNLIAELNGKNNDSVIRTYIWGLDVSETIGGAGGVGGLLMVDEYNNVLLPVYDLNGNIVAISYGSEGGISAMCEYSPFGEEIPPSGYVPYSIPFRFSTKYCDSETGLLYYGYRYYSPGLGRWLSRDPIEEQGGLNLYGFVNNDPVNRVDWLGQYEFNSSIELCNRMIENPTNNFVIGIANLRGHHFYRWIDEKKGNYGSIGMTEPKTKRGGLPNEDEPNNARVCKKCYKTGAILKYGSYCGTRKRGYDSSDKDIQECLKNRPLTGNIFSENYHGLLNNCNDWASGAAKDCGISCSGEAYLVKRLEK